MKKSTPTILATALLALGLSSAALAESDVKPQSVPDTSDKGILHNAVPAASQTVRFNYQNNLYLIDGSHANVALVSNYHMKKGGHCWKSDKQVPVATDTVAVHNGYEFSPDIQDCHGDNDFVTLEIVGDDVDKFTTQVVKIETSHIPKGVLCVYNITSSYDLDTKKYTPVVHVNHDVCLKSYHE